MLASLHNVPEPHRLRIKLQLTPMQSLTLTSHQAACQKGFRVKKARKCSFLTVDPWDAVPSGPISIKPGLSLPLEKGGRSWCPSEHQLSAVTLLPGERLLPHEVWRHLGLEKYTLGIVTKESWFKSLLYHVLAVWPWASDLTTLNLSLQTFLYPWFEKTAPPAEPQHSHRKGSRVCVTVTPIAPGPSESFPNTLLSAVT